MSGSSRRWHGPVARLLTVLGALLVVVSIAANFVERQALDSEEFESTAEQLITDPAIQEKVAATLTDRLFTAVDVQAELEAALPEEQKALAGAIAGGLRPVAERLARGLLDRPRLQGVWVEAAGAAQAQVVRVLDDEARFLETEGRVVYLDLRPLLVELTDQLPIVPNLSERVPEDAGLIAVMETDELGTAQDVTRLLRLVADWIWVLALACWIGAVYLARDRRREVRAIALGFVVVGVLVLVVRRVAGRYVVDELSAAPSDEDAIQRTWDILTRILADAGWGAVALGIVALAGIWLVGEHRYARVARRRLAPTLRSPAWSFGGGAVLFLLLVLWSPVSYIENPLVLLVLAVLTALGVGVLRRLTARELLAESTDADAPPPAVAGTPRAPERN